MLCLQNEGKLPFAFCGFRQKRMVFDGDAFSLQDQNLMVLLVLNTGNDQGFGPFVNLELAEVPSAHDGGYEELFVGAFVDVATDHVVGLAADREGF